MGETAHNAASAPLLPTALLSPLSFDFAAYQALGEQLNGTPVVVNIWSSWCGPCRSEAPDLASAARAFGDRVQFLGVDILDKRPAAMASIKRYGWTCPSLFDPGGEIRDRLGFVGQPETLFYNAEGKLLATWIGPLTRMVLEESIRKVIS
jgi:cytochrome c biogenesis protein CcmG, thiol:disulfide interchange protein DsbE